MQFGSRARHHHCLLRLRCLPWLLADESLWSRACAGDEWNTPGLARGGSTLDEGSSQASGIFIPASRSRGHTTYVAQYIAGHPRDRKTGHSGCAFERPNSSGISSGHRGPRKVPGALAISPAPYICTQTCCARPTAPSSIRKHCVSSSRNAEWFPSAASSLTAP